MQLFARTRAIVSRSRASRYVVLLLAFAGVFYFLRGAWPVTHRIEVVLPEGSRVMAIHVEFRRDGESLRAYERRFRNGAPRRVRFGARLAPGEYEAVLRVERHDGRMAEWSRRLELEGDAVHLLSAGN